MLLNLQKLMKSKSDNLKRVIRWIKDQAKYYICFCKVALFVAAAVYCHNFVNYNVISMLAIYFSTEALKEDKISRSVLLVNVREALQVLVKMGVYATRSHFRKIVIFSTSLYILGLILLYLSASDQISGTYIGLHLISGLIAAGKAGGLSTLKTYLLDEMIAGHEKIPDIDYNRAEWRANIWVWVSLIGVFLQSFITSSFTQQSWPRRFLNSAYLIAAAALFSLSGSFLSHRTQYWRKKSESDTLPPDHRNLENNGNEMIEEQQQKSSSHSSVKQEYVAKVDVLKMIPMWSAFVVPGLVISSANTFFTLQDDNMTAQVTTSNFLLAKDALKEIVAFLCQFLVSKRLSKSQQNLALKLRLFLGMMFSVLCPSFAWQVEVKRLKMVQEMVDESEDTKAPMSDWWLAPQFCVWGLMEGLAVSGLDEYFAYHVSNSLEELGSQVLNKIPVEIAGNILSAVCVSSCKWWFGDTFNQSRLDNYFWMITVIGWLNLCWFFFVSTCYSPQKVGNELV